MMGTRLMLVSLLSLYFVGVQGALIIEVLTYPARIYINAPPDVPVLKVHAYDNVTRTAFSSLILSTGKNSTYFRINSDGVLLTAKTINLPLGTLLQFFVFGAINGMTNYKHVKIIVSRKNLYPPEFSQKEYRFTAYRYGVNSTIGQLHARDLDIDYYNRQFKYYLKYKMVRDYVTLSQKGEIILRKAPPETLTEMEFNVTAVDMGSPPGESVTTVHLIISDVRQPSAFCFSTDKHTVTICWLNPMKGHSVNSYTVQVTGSISQQHVVQGDANASEICHTISGTQLGQQYFFKVWVTSAPTTPTGIVRLMLNTTGIGFTPECLHYGFDACNYLQPCSNGGQCQKQSSSVYSINYQCDCLSGWKGKNCTSRDLCHNNPCGNNGTCNYIAHEAYSCNCIDNFLGKDCQVFNVCSQFPCHNGGQCSMLNDGSYSCSCPDHFSGQNCETPDPCKPSPCLKGGSCVRRSDTAFDCHCQKGFYGHVCSEINPCLRETVCQQNGTCTHTGNNTFVCHCLPGTTGERCDKFDPCSITGICMNNATCYMKTTGTLYGCHCLPGYYGGECQHYDKCYGIDCGNGTCRYDRIKGEVSCKCDKGYYGPSCEHINVCLALNPCGNRGRCENTSDSGYVCHCSDKFYGPNCTNVNSCLIVKCQNGGTCMISDPNRYQCACPNGYYDDYCESYNPCVSFPCENGGTCTNTSSNHYSCSCSDGYFGNNCHRRDPCFPNPCLNGGTCYNTTNDDFICECTPDYMGRTCRLLNPCLSNPCLNNGVCHPLNVLSDEDHVTFQCNCTERFTGERCETKVRPCQLVDCGTGKRCEARGEDDYVCVCVNQSPKPDCAPVCPAINETGTYGTYEWPELSVGEVTNISCFYGVLSTAKTGQARKQCVSNNKWSASDYRDCSELGLLEATKKLDELKGLTSDPSGLNAHEVANFTIILEDVFHYAFVEKKIAESVVQVISNIVDVNISVIKQSNDLNQTSERMLYLLDKYTADVQSETQISLSSANIHLAAVDVNRHDVPNEIEFHPELLDGNETSDEGMFIKLPREVLQKAINTTRPSARLQFVGFRRSSFFIPKNARLEDVKERSVITASVRQTRVTGLKSPVIYKMNTAQFGNNASCVFWNDTTKSWSREGIVTIRKKNNVTECQSSHLTSFAVLMDPNPVGEMLPLIHEEILSYISYIGIAISLMSLVITILTYSLFRSLRNEKSGKILLNLCAAMMLMDVSFLLGSQSSQYGDGLCTTVAVLLHYFLLATFMWMLVEALEMYRALVTVFAKYARWYMLKRCIAAWGIPLIIVGITLGADVGHYQSKRDFCFISEGSQIAYYTSLMAPCCLVIIINTVVFLIVSRVIMKPRFQQSTKTEGSITPAQFRGAFTVMILLGITWVFGPLAIVGGAKIVFNYLFCILNSLQGFLIFVFRCVFNPEARLCWLQLVKTGTLKRKRGPVKSVYSDYSSKGDNSKSRLNGSYVNAGTMKTNIVHSNGWHPQLNGLPHENGKPRKDSEMFTFDLNTREFDTSSTKADIYFDNHTPPRDLEKDLEDCYTHL